MGDSSGAAWHRRRMELAGVHGKDGRGPGCFRGVQGCGTLLQQCRQVSARLRPSLRARGLIAALAMIPQVAMKHPWVLPFIQSVSDAFQRQCWAPRVGLFSRNAAQPQVPPQILWVISGMGAGRASN